MLAYVALMASLKRASAIYLAAAALNAAVPFSVLPFLTRWLGPAEFGIAGNYLAMVNLAAVVAGLSVHGIISVVHFKQGADAVAAYVFGSLRLLMFTGMPLLGALAMFGPWIEEVSAVPARWVWTIGMVAAFQFVVAVGLVVFQTREEPVSYAVAQVGVALGWGLMSLVFVGWSGMGWQGRALAQLIAVAAVATAIVWRLRRMGLLKRSEQSATTASLLAFGLPMVPHSLAAASMAGADRLMLTAASGTEATGQYFAAFQIAAVLTVAAAAINQAWVPWLYRALASGDPQREHQVVRTTYSIYAGILAAAAFVALAGAWLLPLVVGAQFRSAAPLLMWLAPAAALSGMYYFVTNYLFYAGRTGVLSVISVACSALQLALMTWAVPRWGAQGAASSVFFAALCYWLATWFAAQRAIRMPWALGFAKGAT